MARHLTIEVSLTDNDRGTTWANSFDVTTSDDTVACGEQPIGASEEAIDLGQLTTLGWGYFENLDETRTIELRKATGAPEDIIQLSPGESMVIHFGSDVSAPFAIASSATAILRYVIFSI